MSEIREIYNNVAGIPKDGKPRMGYEEFHQAIISAIFEKMPKEKGFPNHFDLCLLSNEDRASEEGEINGFNSALAETRERINSL